MRRADSLAPNARALAPWRAATASQRAARRSLLLATGVLLAVSFAYRAPALLNAASTNSDAAVVGLQAMHLLRGEVTPFLWGSGYQTSADSFAAAGAFAIIGPSPLALMLSALVLHVLATWLTFAIARRRVSSWAALVVVSPLVLSPSSIHSYALYPPRQLSLTLAVAALWAIDTAATRRSSRTSAWLGAGGLLYGLAVSADPYPLVLAPIVLGYALVVTFEQPWDHLPWLGTGAIAGFVPFALIHRAAGAKSGPLGLSTSVIGHNWDLLVRECLPWALSYDVRTPRGVRDAMSYVPWDAPVLVEVIQRMGAFIVFGVVGLGLAAIAMKRMPSAVRVVGFIGALAFPTTIAGFLVSVMVMDHFSMRYLTTLTLLLPLASLPALHVVGLRRFAVLMAPHLVASTLCGWVGYGPRAVHGVVPVRDRAQLERDEALFAHLAANGVRYAEADYWASYRLTFLSRERFVVVPINPNEDRYAPYREAFVAAPVYAYVFDPSRSREDVDARERELRASGARVEKATVAGQTVFVVARR